jgi:hypothetical protein
MATFTNRDRGVSVTTPAPDAPLVFPSVVFRPIRLLIICLVLTAVAIAGSASRNHLTFGIFVGIGLLMGLLNALLVHRSVNTITAGAHPLKTQMAMNSASRLFVLTVIGLIIAFVFRPAGLGVVFGLAVFQVLLVASTALPVLRKLRAGGGEPSPSGDTGTAERLDGRDNGDD